MSSVSRCYECFDKYLECHVQNILCRQSLIQKLFQLNKKMNEKNSKVRSGEISYSLSGLPSDLLRLILEYSSGQDLPKMLLVNQKIGSLAREMLITRYTKSFNLKFLNLATKLIEPKLRKISDASEKDRYSKQLASVRTSIQECEERLKQAQDLLKEHEKLKQQIMQRIPFCLNPSSN